MKNFGNELTAILAIILIETLFLLKQQNDTRDVITAIFVSAIMVVGAIYNKENKNG